MDLNFFLICFGLLGCYAALRTVRRGWVRVLIVFLMVVCLIKIGFDQLLPMPTYVAQRPSNPASSSSSLSVNLANVHGYVAQTVADLEDDRCIMENLEDTPLGPVAYLMDAHKFLREYRDMQAQAVTGGASLISMQQALNNTVAPQPAGGPSVCDRFTQWLQAQAQAKIQNALAPQARVPSSPAPVESDEQ